MSWPPLPPPRLAVTWAALDEGTRRQLSSRLARLERAARERWEDASWHATRAKATRVRQEAVAHLADYLLQAETAAAARGFRVSWAESADQAIACVLDVLGSPGLPVAVVRSPLVEELALPTALEGAGYEVVMTDVGGHATWVIEERPSHRSVPLAHLYERDVASLWEMTTGQHVLPITANVVEAVQGQLRALLYRADTAVVGVHGIVAETGTPFLLDPEGGAAVALARARRVVVLVGIEQVVPTLDDAVTVAAAWSGAALGEPCVPWTVFLFPAAHRWEEAWVVWVDNGRSQMLAEGWGELLRCIHCGACATVCPVVREVGDHPWGTPYAGPVAFVWGPRLRPETHGALPFASTLCTACGPVCPVGIDLPRLIARAQQEAAEQTRLPSPWRFLPVLGRWFQALQASNGPWSKQPKAALNAGEEKQAAR